MQLVTAAIIKKDEKFLIAKRKAGGVVGGKWEFPGGKVESNESPQECLRRELKEELDIEVAVGEFFDQCVYHYETGNLNLCVYCVDYRGDAFELREHDEIRWVLASELVNFDFVGNDRLLVKKLMKRPDLSTEIGFLLSNMTPD